jgi:hypothetical protein
MTHSTTDAANPSHFRTRPRKGPGRTGNRNRRKPLGRLLNAGRRRSKPEIEPPRNDRVSRRNRPVASADLDIHPGISPIAIRFRNKGALEPSATQGEVSRTLRIGAARNRFDSKNGALKPAALKTVRRNGIPRVPPDAPAKCSKTCATYLVTMPLAVIVSMLTF